MKPESVPNYDIKRIVDNEKRHSIGNVSPRDREKFMRRNTRVQTSKTYSHWNLSRIKGRTKTAIGTVTKKEEQIPSMQSSICSESIEDVELLRLKTQDFLEKELEKRKVPRFMFHPDKTAKS